MSALLKNSWKIIFTTRYSYLDDLKFQFIEVYRLIFQTINLENLSKKQLHALSDKYDFELPSDKRLQSRIENLFYLDEYLQNYQSCGDEIDYTILKMFYGKRKYKIQLSEKIICTLKEKKSF